MGSKFEHIQIKSKDKQDIYPYLAPSDTICHVAEDWLAILPENLNYTVTPKRAKKLSRKEINLNLIFVALWSFIMTPKINFGRSSD